MESKPALSNSPVLDRNMPMCALGTMANESRRRKGQPAQDRALCPSCGRKGLGNTYAARFHVEEPYAYRQCRFCGQRHRLEGAALPSAPERKPDFPRNKIERAVYEHYLSGVERGDLYRYVKLGRAGLAGPERSHSAAYAAWMAGKALAQKE